MGAEPQRHLALRVAVAALVCVDLLRMGVEITLLDAPFYLGYGGRMASGLQAYLTSTAWVIAALSAVGAVRWARWRSTLGGAIALVGLSALCLIHSHLRGEHDESLFYAGILLAGWLTTEAIASVRESEDDPSAWGARGALAFLAGSYVAAGLSKAGSASWWDGENLRLALAMATDIYPGSVWLGVRQWMADATWLTPVLAVLTVAVELGGVLLVGGPRARMWAGTALWCLHLGIFIALGVLFPEPLLLLPLMTWPWHRRVPGVAGLVSSAPRRAGWSDGVMALAALCATAGLWLSATSAAPVFASLHDPAPLHLYQAQPQEAMKGDLRVKEGAQRLQGDQGRPSKLLWRTNHGRAPLGPTPKQLPLFAGPRRPWLCCLKLAIPHIAGPPRALPGTTTPRRRPGNYFGATP